MRVARTILLASTVVGLMSCAGSSRQGRLGLGLAGTALASGAPNLALQISEAVLAEHPNDVPALLREGDAYLQLGDPARAGASYRRALAIQPRSVEARLGLGRVALLADPGDAEQRFTEVLALDPANQAALTDRGIALDLLGRHGSAQADYRRAIDQGGDVTPTEVDLALSLAISGDAGTAVRMLEPIADQPNASARTRQDLAVALVLDGRSEDAKRLLLTQMSAADVERAVAAYRALLNQPLSPSLLEGGS